MESEINPKLPQGKRFSGHPLCYCSTLSDSTCDFCSGTRYDPFVQLAISWSEEASNCERRAENSAADISVIAIMQLERAKIFRQCAKDITNLVRENYR